MSCLNRFTKYGGLWRKGVARFSISTTLRATTRSTQDYLQCDDSLKSQYDAIIIGAGHNGLISAAYLQQAGLKVCVLERRHLVGGAAVTEELVPGYKFSRASYVLSLLRPKIIKDLELKRFGLKVYLRDPSSYTPVLGEGGGGKSLLLGRDHQKNHQQISQFSRKDADAFVKYESQLDRIISAIDPLLDYPPVHIPSWIKGSWRDQWNNWPSMKVLLKSLQGLKGDAAGFYNLMTAPASKVLDGWFDSEPLKATLASDSVIGAMNSPHDTGSGYVLLHHVMGELEGIKGAWGYVEGGMGAVSESIARSANDKGAEIYVNKPVAGITTDSSGKVKGVTLQDGSEISAKVILSNATAKVTFLDLVKKDLLDDEFTKDISQINFTSPVTKINIAVNRLPNFTANPNPADNTPQPHHRGTIHLNCESMDIIHQGYLDAAQGHYSKTPMIEMTIPSSLDPTVAPPGCHVVQLFTQYTPYTLAGGQAWTDQLRQEYANTVFDYIEKYAPGFKESIVGTDILTPPDIERVFNITGGNIFHGSMSLDQLYSFRPLPAFSDYRTPLKGLYICGSSAHPGGGVMGSAGRLCSQTVLKDFKGL